MCEWDERDELERERQRWEETTLRRNLERLGLERSPVRLYTPLDVKPKRYMERLGFPGEYPFTRGTYAVPLMATAYGGDAMGVRPTAGVYAGYGTAEDTRDLWRQERRRGANVAFDLPTQCGYDSDHPMAEGEVGRVGVAIDTLADFETLYEAFDGITTLDRMASNFTINAPCNIILAMYFALAEKKGVPWSKLRGTPQNDILKEFAARGTYIFPPRPSMRMIRDTITFCHKYAPEMNVISICGYHMREAGATEVQASGFTFAHAIAYVQLGVDAGLDVDEFIPRFTFLDFGGGMDFWREIARARANRRIWARIMRERFGAKNPRSWIMRGGDSIFVGPSCYTLQRPLNNLIRGVIGGIASYLATGFGTGGVPWDEPLGLGHSYEARQLTLDATRIMRFEAKLGEVVDPLAGSYFVEALTDQVEEEIWDVIRKVDEIGGAVEAIETGYTLREIARSAYEQQRQLETGERVIVGVNKFTGENEIEVIPPRLVPHPYDPKRLETAEERQKAKLKKIKEERDQARVNMALKAIREAAKNEKENLIPYFIDAVKAYCTIGEICDVLRDVFGVWEPKGVI
ncbi:MAG: methylmalonyl-CoA mutase family protein [Dehalococcoidia bacterium]|jgi:methylmalonyl-CoA mutase N-terminal domain/subunit|nr:methylmalonyl-CoA mutase family protein [Dehalococcoidia bacterium]